MHTRFLDKGMHSKQYIFGKKMWGLRARKVSYCWRCSLHYYPPAAVGVSPYSLPTEGRSYCVKEPEELQTADTMESI